MKKLFNWFKSLSTKKKVMVVLACIVLLGLISKNTKSKYNNGEGEITHYTAKDWDKNAMFKGIGTDVLEFVTEHPDANKLTLIIIDECTDEKGNKSEYESKIIFNREDIKEYSEYKDADSFNENCLDFGYKLGVEWHPCGNSNF